MLTMTFHKVLGYLLTVSVGLREPVASGGFSFRFTQPKPNKQSIASVSVAAELSKDIQEVFATPRRD
ncbi:hypothetical protein M378DRAFT_912952 [Amanita muscaria Koide BX008]|uniref:Secreted protein n=1 Tax=Amanita muscaria (strain Koide BX008) TaxID=946122 RepID=A0A0C2WV50_AMAMK|nr:hypothetical protein M378DRAFT_912952 [Amanita muscaria Koide BX008]